MAKSGRNDDEIDGVSRPVALGECPPGHDPHLYTTTLDVRFSDMRALLARVRPSTDAEALRALRTAFPGTSLSDRVAALTSRQS